MPGGVRELVEGRIGVGGRVRILGHSRTPRGTWGNLLYFADPRVPLLCGGHHIPASSPWGQVHRAARGRLTVASLGPLSAAPVSLVRWCVPRSSAQVPPCSGPRNRQWWGLGDGVPFSNQPGGVRGAPRKLGSREDLTCLTHPVPFPCTRPGSGLWLEPLDPVEPLQPQL